MKRVLLVITTTSYRAEAFLDAAARLGLEATVATEREAALRPADRATLLRVEMTDVEAGARTIAEFARAHPLDAVLAADDEGAMVAARAAEILGLRGNPPGAVMASRNKRMMREALAAGAVPCPWFRAIPTGADPRAWAGRVPYPCVLKPTFLAGSRGVTRVDEPAEFEWAFARIAGMLADPAIAARGGEWAGEILVEAYIPGPEVALEGLLSGGDLRTLAIFDKPDPLEGPYFEETIYVTPSRLPAEGQAALIDMTARSARALGLGEGALHAELRLNEAGAWTLEIAPRSIGGLCSRALRFGDGSIALEELLLRHALREEVAGVTRETRAAAVMMIPIPRAGILEEVRGAEEARAVPSIEEVRLTIPPGHLVVPPPEGSRYLGFIFARAGGAREAEEALRDAHRRLEFRITEVD